MKKFEIGKTYYTKSICDSNCIFSNKIIDRTAKTVTLDNNKKLRIYVYEDVERIKPLGNYSMCPVYSADKELKA